MRTRPRLTGAAHDARSNASAWTGRTPRSTRALEQLRKHAPLALPGAARIHLSDRFDGVIVMPCLVVPHGIVDQVVDLLRESRTPVDMRNHAGEFRGGQPRWPPSLPIINCLQVLLLATDARVPHDPPGAYRPPRADARPRERTSS